MSFKYQRNHEKIVLSELSVYPSIGYSFSFYFYNPFSLSLFLHLSLPLCIIGIVYNLFFHILYICFFSVLLLSSSAYYQMPSFFFLKSCQPRSLRSFCMVWLNFTAYTWNLWDFSPCEDVHLQWANQLFSAATCSWQICDPPVSVYKGYAMPKDTEEYLLSCGLKNALYSVRAADLTEDLFGTLVPCPFQVSQYV